MSKSCFVKNYILCRHFPSCDYSLNTDTVYRELLCTRLNSKLKFNFDKIDLSLIRFFLVVKNFDNIFLCKIYFKINVTGLK